MISLIKKYIHFYKKEYVPILLTVFFSSLLLTSLFISKDSYDNYNFNLSKELYGNYDVKVSLYDYKENKIEGLTILNYENSIHTEDGTNLTFFTNLDVYPIQIIQGTSGKNNEILLHKKYKNKYKIGDTFEGYTISGFYKNLNAEIVNDTAYLKSTDKKSCMYIYANVRSKDILNSLPETYEINQNLVTTKYHLNTAFENAFTLFYILITLYCFLFVYHAFYLHLSKKEETFNKLHNLGISYKQLSKMIWIENVYLYVPAFFISFIFSIALWYIILHLPFHLLIPLKFSITKIHCLILILSILSTYILSIFFSLQKSKRKHKQNLHFRKLNLRIFPTSTQLVILDLLRSGYGILLILLLCFSTSFIGVSNSMIHMWKAQINDEISYKHDISANFDIFDHSSISYFLDSCSTILKDTTHEFNYSINCLALDSHQNEIEIKVINENKYILENSDSNTIAIRILKKGQETIDTIYVDVDKHIVSKSKTITLYVPKAEMMEWFNTYPDSYLTGSLWVNTKNPSAIYSKLNDITISQEDEFYLVDNNSDAQIIQNSTTMILLFVYAFYFIVIISCIFVSYSQIYQYLLSRKREIELMHTLGITYKKIHRLYIFQTLLLFILSVCLCILLSILFKIKLQSIFGFIIFLMFVLYAFVTKTALSKI